jgi:hypothetical protein
MEAFRDLPADPAAQVGRDRRDRLRAHPALDIHGRAEPPLLTGGVDQHVVRDHHRRQRVGLVLPGLPGDRLVLKVG